MTLAVQSEAERADPEGAAVPYAASGMTRADGREVPNVDGPVLLLLAVIDRANEDSSGVGPLMSRGCSCGRPVDDCARAYLARLRRVARSPTFGVDSILGRSAPTRRGRRTDQGKLWAHYAPASPAINAKAPPGVQPDGAREESCDAASSAGVYPSGT